MQNETNVAGLDSLPESGLIAEVLRRRRLVSDITGSLIPDDQNSRHLDAVIATCIVKTA